MKVYIILFISILFLIITSVTYMGMLSTLKVLDQGSVSNENDIIENIRKEVTNIYKSNKQLKDEIISLSLKIDTLHAGLNRRNILREKIFQRAVLGLILTAIIGLLAGILLWIGNLKLIIKPIDKTVKELKRVASLDWEGNISLNGSKEIKYLQMTLNNLISDLKSYRNRVKQIERENLGSFITHKIKNSLTPIHLCAYNIKDIVKDNKFAQENVNLIISEIIKTEQFITQLKGFLKTPVLNKESIELVDFLYKLTNKYCGVRFQKNDSEFYIKGDLILIEEALVNIIQNGLDASKSEDDTVEVSIEYGESPIIKIEDKGCGISKEDISKVFDEYYTTKQKGMGIGLSYVKKIIDSHGFKLLIESELNKGTVVRIVCNG